MLWGGVGFHRGDNPTVPEQNAKGTCQDAQRKDTKGLWDQQKVKDLREIHSCNCFPPPTSLWAALFTRGSQPASAAARQRSWPQPSADQGQPGGSEELQTHRAAGTCSSARKPAERTWPLSPLSWSCPQSQSASLIQQGKSPTNATAGSGGTMETPGLAEPCTSLLSQRTCRHRVCHRPSSYKGHVRQ